MKLPAILLGGIAALVPTASGLSPVAPGEDAPELWLERLASGSASERESAQRWLAANLEDRDYPLLAGVARDADAEMSRRLALALSSEGRHLGLVILLQGEQDETLVSIGKAAFEDLVTRWCPGAAGRSVSRSTVERLLDSRAERSFRSPGRLEGLEAAIDRFARQMDFGVPVVLLPSAAEREVRFPATDGHMLELLAELCIGNGLTYTGVGEWNGTEPGRQAWILVSPMSGARSSTGAARLARWCRSIATGAPDAAACARSLASCGWPAAMLWLDRRWTERRDVNALEGLISAAAFGRVGRSLQLASEREALLERADRALDSTEEMLDRIDGEAGDSRTTPGQGLAERIARALIGAGAMTLGGQGLAADWLADWSSLNDAQRWLRLYILEGQRAGGKSVRDFLRARVEEPDSGPPALRFQALRALAASPGRSPRAPQVAGLADLARWAIGSGREWDFLIVLGALHVEPHAQGFGTDPTENRLLLHWWLRSGDAPAAARQLVRCAAQPPRNEREILSTRLGHWRVSFGPRFLDEVVALALAELSGDELESLIEIALHGGCLDVRRHQEIFRELSEKQDLSVHELESIGAMAAGPVGSQARTFLLKTLADPPQDAVSREGLARAFDLAVQALYGSGLSDRSLQFIQTVWELVEDPESPLHGRLGPQAWPRKVPAVVVDLGRLEREIPASLIANGS